MASHTLLILPYEMVHEITKNIKGLKNDRRTSLIKLGNTCRHFRSHVLGMLISSPIMGINKTPLLVYTYWKYPRYLSKAKFLEVREKPLREEEWIDCFPLENLLPYCEDIINKTGIHGLPPRFPFTQVLHPRIKVWEATAKIAQKLEEINLEIFTGCYAFNNISEDAEKIYNRRQRGKFLHLLQLNGYFDGSKDSFHWQRGDGVEEDVFLRPEYWDHIYHTFFKIHKK